MFNKNFRDGGKQEAKVFFRPYSNRLWYKLKASHADFFPFPAKADTVSQPVNA